MNRKNLFFLPLTVVFFLPTTPLVAELLPIDTLFKQMDQNKDGYIDRKEINDQSLLATEFDKVDKNKDGNLDNREFKFFIADADF